MPLAIRLLRALSVVGSVVYQMAPLARRASMSTSAAEHALTLSGPIPSLRSSRDSGRTDTTTLARCPPSLTLTSSAVAPLAAANLLAAAWGPTPVAKSGNDSCTAASAAEFAASLALHLAAM